MYIVVSDATVGAGISLHQARACDLDQDMVPVKMYHILEETGSNARLAAEEHRGRPEGSFKVSGDQKLGH